MLKANFAENDLFKKAMTVIQPLRDEGFVAYFVGGSVRDMLLGKSPKDIDIVTDARPEQVTALFPGSLLVGACFGVVNVIVDHIHFEVATFRQERNYEDGRHPEEVSYANSPEVDASRRDFTINGLYYDPVEDRVLDVVGGVPDLQKGIVRCIGNAEERFLEDYLRMLRAVRFAARLDFVIDPQTAVAIAKLADKVGKLSVERVRVELNTMFTGAHPARALTYLADLGLLEVVLPEVAATKGVTQPERFHPEGDVFEHILLMLEHMALPSIELAWSIILHDIGKPETLSVDEDGIEHFYGHEGEGAAIAEDILNRLRFSRKETERIVSATRTHMRYAHVHRMKPAKLRRLLADPGFVLELELHRIDCISSNMRLENFCFLLDTVEAMEEQIELPEPLIKGRDLIELGLKPGPPFGKILEEMMNLQLDGKFSTKDDALKHLKTVIEKKAPGPLSV